jgi:hypothetical protein
MNLKDTSPKKSKAIKENKKAPFLEAFARIGTISGAAEAVGISRYAVHDWKNNDPAFDEAFRQAETALTENLESVAVDKALKGDNQLIQFLLKARAPQKYTERYKHEIESAQFGQLIGLMTSVLKRVVPQQLWPRIAVELEAAANSLEIGNVNHLLQ